MLLILGAVLSQRYDLDNDVGSREFLLKLALEEWRHWLVGNEQPFLVWTGHKSLAYLQNKQVR